MYQSFLDLESTAVDYFCQLFWLNCFEFLLCSNRQTARSKGYAFVEFACDEVAKIVAETMHNYMMFGKLLKCEYKKAKDFSQHIE